MLVNNVKMDRLNPSISTRTIKPLLLLLTELNSLELLIKLQASHVMQIAETILLTEALSNEGLYVNVNVNTIPE